MPFRFISATLLLFIFSSEGYQAPLRNLRNLGTLSTSFGVTLDLKQTETDIKTWYLMTEQQRPEVSISSAETVSEAMSDVWKNVLISLRIFDNDPELTSFVSVFALPYLSGNDIDSLQLTINTAIESLESESHIFQPDVARRIKVLKKLSQNEPKELVCVSVATQRTKSAVVSFQDMDLGEEFYPKDMESTDVWNNNIPSFPFPSVFDFISEINRPPDEVIMNNLRFNFVVEDLKYDISKMKKKKKDPQVIIDSLNCKLTRLQNWRDVLEAYQDSIANPFMDITAWTKDVKVKYRSLKALSQEDPQAILDTQYDKRKTFIKIIDQWSDRLKRNFKYYYQGQRRTSSPLNEDFTKQLQGAKWRTSYSNLMNTFNDAPFLRLKHEEETFSPGTPSKTFRLELDRLELYPTIFPMGIVAGEMMSWLSHLDKVQGYSRDIVKMDPMGQTGSIPTSSSKKWLPIRSISQQSYSRGFVSERIFHDMWTAISKWENQEYTLKSESSENALKSSSPKDCVSHHDNFVEALRRVNEFSRKESRESSSSVRDMYKHWASSSRLSIEWLSSLVSDLDIDTELNRKLADQERRRRSKNLFQNEETSRDFNWFDTISNAVESDAANKEIASVTSSKSKRENVQYNTEKEEDDPEVNIKLWNTYGPLVQKAKIIQDISTSIDNNTDVGYAHFLSWQEGLLTAAEQFTRDIKDACNTTGKSGGGESLFTFSGHIPLSTGGISDDDNNNDDEAMLFVIPRSFKELGNTADELNSFLSICKVALAQIKDTYIRGKSLQMIPLHPAMINQKGAPNYYRRSPHPAILFFLK